MLLRPSLYVATYSVIRRYGQRHGLATQTMGRRPAERRTLAIGELFFAPIAVSYRKETLLGGEGVKESGVQP